MSFENSHNNIIADGASFSHTSGNQFNFNITVTNVRTAIQCIQQVASQVNDGDGLSNVSNQLEHILLAIQDNQQHDLIRSDEYTDALTAVSSFVERAQRATQRQLKRSLGDFTWNQDEIAVELERISNDLNKYLPEHIIQNFDTNNVSSERHFASLTSTLEEIMAKLVEIELRLDVPKGANWSPSILNRAMHNVNLRGQAEENSSRRTTTSLIDTTRLDGQEAEAQEEQSLGQVRKLAEAGRTTITLQSLRCRKHDEGYITDKDVVIQDIKINATLEDIQHAIESRGYEVPMLVEDAMLVTVTERETEFDATAPGGLKIEKSMPLLWWWNKYNTYHGLVPSTTPGHTIATLNNNGNAITVAGVKFRFHRTLRVPNSEEKNRLPLDLGTFPLVPVSKFAHRLPENITTRGGFLMPMYQREALWISFKDIRNDRPAIKVSTGSVNAITGFVKDTSTPPNNEQDYIIAGLQPWLDGIMTEPGVVRQFVAIQHGKDYTVEEQITGKAEHGGLQFDIFPRRLEPPRRGQFYEYYMNFYDSEDFGVRADTGRLLASHLTADEAGVLVGNTIGVFPRTFGGIQSKNWTLSSYRRRICGSAGRIRTKYNVEVTYGSLRRSPMIGGSRFSQSLFQDEAWTDSLADLSHLTESAPFDAPSSLSSNVMDFAISPLGLAAGGKIEQRIYKNTVSPRMYDGENGHRFHVHILSPEAWELITGVLPPISPITEDTYKANNIPWYSILDDHIPSLNKVSEALQSIKSVDQLDVAQKTAKIDPNCPPACAFHRQSPIVCVFRPCSHTACDACLGRALRTRSECPQCRATVIRFVGIKEPILNVTEYAPSESGQETWNVTASGIENLARQAAESNNVTIIHLEGDKVSGLHGDSQVKGKGRANDFQYWSDDDEFE